MRITNIDTLSALLDRLITERIKEYNFTKQGKPEEAEHQKVVSEEIKKRLIELLGEVYNTGSYEFIGEKRTFDEAKLIQDVETLIVSDLDVGHAYYTKTEGEPTVEKYIVNEAKLRKANENRGRAKNDIDHNFSHVKINNMAKRFKAAKPFPHIVIDNFFDNEDLVARAVSEFPPESSDIFTWKSNDSNSKKLMCQDYDKLAAVPNIRHMIDYFNSDHFIKSLESLTGIKKLKADPSLSGGGVHQIMNGGFLKVHADFNVADNMPGHYRRLNVIYYLNEDWKPEYNGQLELWDEDLTECKKIIDPILNRVVVFDTQPKNTVAFHGHPKPLNTPKGVSRKSIALYYYTKEKPDTKYDDAHKTIYAHV